MFYILNELLGSIKCFISNNNNNKMAGDLITRVNHKSLLFLYRYSEWMERYAQKIIIIIIKGNVANKAVFTNTCSVASKGTKVQNI